MKNEKRIRITKAEVEKARIALIRSNNNGKQHKHGSGRRYNDFWYGVLYCDHQGLAVIATTQDNAKILGKTEDIIKLLKERKVDKENPEAIIKAIEGFQAEKKKPSCHSASVNRQGGTTIPLQKSNRATFMADENFVRLIEGFIAKRIGLPTIQRELSSKGYEVAYRTLGRWVHKRKLKRKKIKISSN